MSTAVTIGYPVRPIRYRVMNLIFKYLPFTKKYYHNSVLLVKETAGGSQQRNIEGFDFKLAEDADIASIIRHQEALSPGVYEKRLKFGDRCYCLVAGKEIVSYNWVRHKTCCVLCGFDRGLEFFPISDDQAFTYDFYTYKARRGQGLGELTKRALIQYLSRHGIKNIYTLIMPYNHISMKIHLRLGYVPFQMVYGYRIGNWYRTYYGTATEKKWLDEWVNQFKSSMNIKDTQDESRI